MTTPPITLHPVIPRARTSNEVLRDYHDVLEHLLGGGMMTNAGYFDIDGSTDHPRVYAERVDPELTYALMAVVLAGPAWRRCSLPVVKESLKMAALALDAGWQAVVNELREDD